MKKDTFLIFASAAVLAGAVFLYSGCSQEVGVSGVPVVQEGDHTMSGEESKNSTSRFTDMDIPPDRVSITIRNTGGFGGSVNLYGTVNIEWDTFTISTYDKGKFEHNTRFAHLAGLSAEEIYLENEDEPYIIKMSLAYIESICTPGRLLYRYDMPR